MELKTDPNRPDKHIDPATGIWPIEEWGAACERGFVSSARFGSGTVIKRTDRNTTRRWRQCKESPEHGERSGVRTE